MSSSPAKSYSQILKSSSLIGGAQAINLLIGMLRMKVVAVLIGTAGVGLVGIFQNTINFISTVTALGLAQSGVRSIAEGLGAGNMAGVARSVLILRRACWITGLAGWLLTAALAIPLSHWIFGDKDHTFALVLLGCAVFFAAVASSQTAMLQGFRRVADVARLQIASAVLSTALSGIVYFWLGERGIVPVLMGSAGLHLLCSWWLSRRIDIPKVTVTLTETWSTGKRLATLGLAFMWSAVLATGVALGIQSIVTRTYGIDANGVYQAAWTISGVFANFILNAMGLDFYPRLAALARDKALVNRLVNEQTEIGILLAMPGLIATASLSPWFIRLFYTEQFIAAADLLPWFILGIMGRVVTWPMGYIMPALGATRAFAATETIFYSLQLTLIWVGLLYFGLRGVALGFAASYLIGSAGILWVSNRLTQFTWSASVRALLWKLFLLFSGSMLMFSFFPPVFALVTGLILLFVVGAYSLRELASRLGSEHRINKTLARLPFLKHLASTPKH